jgi:hypothetical protein
LVLLTILRLPKKPRRRTYTVANIPLQILVLDIPACQTQTSSQPNHSALRPLHAICRCAIVPSVAPSLVAPRPSAQRQPQRQLQRQTTPNRFHEAKPSCTTVLVTLKPLDGEPQRRIMILLLDNRLL